MKITLFQMQVLLACLRHCLRVQNLSMEFTTKCLQDVYEQIMQEMSNANLVIDDKELNKKPRKSPVKKTANKKPTTKKTRRIK